jgi:hypothetical protein
MFLKKANESVAMVGSTSKNNRPNFACSSDGMRGMTVISFSLRGDLADFRIIASKILCIILLTNPVVYGVRGSEG